LIKSVKKDMIDSDKRAIKYEGKRHSKSNKLDCRRCFGEGWIV